MPSDLEKFLQQAAERLAQKVNEGQRPTQPKPASGGNQPPVARPQPSAGPSRPSRPATGSTRSAERRPLQAEIVDAEIIEPQTNRRESGPNRLSNIDTRPGLAQQISQTDERMVEHMHDVFDHEVSNLRKPTGQGETEKSIDLQRRQQQVSPLVDMLRQPDSLRAAFIASEIFKRKF